MTDLGLRLLRRGYDAVEEDRHTRGGSDAYPSRLAGRRAVVLRGEAGARIFYDEEIVKRKHAVPAPLAALLFGVGAVHGLDGDEHLSRKQLFFNILTPDRTTALVAEMRDRLARRIDAWASREVSVYDELVEVYGTAVIEWAGVECGEDEALHWSRALARIVDGFGGAGAAYPKAWTARTRCNGWAADVVREARSGARGVKPRTALAIFADSDLSEAVAGVELLNVLRPTVAVAWLGAFAALYLDETSSWRTKLATSETGPAHVAFAQEVRRCTPFAPVLAGKVQRDTSYEDVPIRKGDRVVLDVWGTNQSPEVWDEPHVFRPDRFMQREPGLYDLVPQGGGPPSGHRCPGEPLAVAMLAETVRLLALTDRVVASSHEIDLTRIPTLPPDGPRTRPGG